MRDPKEHVGFSLSRSTEVQARDRKSNDVMVQEKEETELPTSLGGMGLCVTQMEEEREGKGEFL